MTTQVLLLEDNDGDAKIVTRFLSTPDMELARCKAMGEIAPNMQRPDLVLTDLDLIDTAGMETVDQIKARFPEIPIIILTGKRASELGEQAVARGAHTFIEKDLLTVNRLRREIAFALERARVDEIKNQAIHNAKRESEFKSKFLANFSHEIRTPLNAVIGMANLLEPVDSEQEDLLNGLRIGGDRLLSIINDILDISKIEAGKLDLNPQFFNLRGMVGDCLTVFTSEANMRGIFLGDYISQDVPTEIRADQHRIRQVLINYLSNAFKYTDHGFIIVHVTYDAGNIVFDVEDSGRGMSQKQQKILFAPFMQAAAEDTTKGTGLGLAVCKKLSELMGGKVGVESRQGKGSKFWFSIKPEEIRFLETARPSLSDKSVLVVGSEPEPLKLLTRQLQARGITPSITDEIPTQPSDLVIIDARDDLPKHELCRQVQDSQTPILYLASKNTPHCSKTNMIVAPYTQSMVLAKVAQILAPNKSGSESLSGNSANSPAVEMSSAFQGKRILVVDDDPLNRKVLAAMLKRMGSAVEFATNGREAVDFVTQKSADVIFMDCSMPVMDGYEASRTLRTLGKNEVIVALTAHAFVGEEEKCKDAGMDLFLTKPIRPSDISMIADKVSRITRST